ncbi:hypothetical protein [Longimicrobium sp.]|jgi:hypothetical protein|uniref:hypothetical protein n=1 Tax=Longimicrobium sp. TaxID=2029185 RepID=UPI002ED78FE0
MSIQELEAEALKLSPVEREELVRRLLSRLNEDDTADPLLGMGANPVVCGVADASENHDAHLYGTPD